MITPQFHLLNSSTYCLSDLAQQTNANLIGDDISISNIAPLDLAAENSLSFLTNQSKTYLLQLKHTKAKAIICADIKAIEAYLPEHALSFLVHPNPYALFAKISQIIHQNIHHLQVLDAKHTSQVSIAEHTNIASTCKIGAFSTVLENVSIGENTLIASNCTIGQDVQIGKNCKIYSGVHIYEACVIGDNVVIHSGTVVGSDGFGFAPSFSKTEQAWVKIPQMGYVVIEDDVEIGANCTIDRATFSLTRIGKGSKLDNQLQIAHNVDIGQYCVIAGCTAIAGSTKVGDFCIIGGSSQIAGHLTIAPKTTISGGTSVMSSIENSGEHHTGVFPSMPHKLWQKQIALLRRLLKK